MSGNRVTLAVQSIMEEYSGFPEERAKRAVIEALYNLRLLAMINNLDFQNLNEKAAEVFKQSKRDFSRHQLKEEYRVIREEYKVKA